VPHGPPVDGRRSTIVERRTPNAERRTPSGTFAAGRAKGTRPPRTCYGNRYILAVPRVSFGADPTSLAQVDLRQLRALCRGS
jgi:hypothetical protein